MRWLAVIAIVGMGCTRENASFGDTDSATSGADDRADDGSADASAGSVSLTDSQSEASASEATLEGEGEGEGETLGEDGTTGADHSCCQEATLPGCRDEALEACVCGPRPECCSDAWSADCVEKARICGATCDAADSGVETGAETTTSSGGTSESTTSDVDGSSTTGNGSPCCVALEVPNCGNPTIEDCVCAERPGCCEEVWDDVCAMAAMECGAVCG